MQMLFTGSMFQLFGWCGDEMRLPSPSRHNHQKGPAEDVLPAPTQEVQATDPVQYSRKFCNTEGEECVKFLVNVHMLGR